MQRSSSFPAVRPKRARASRIRRSAMVALISMVSAPATALANLPRVAAASSMLGSPQAGGPDTAASGQTRSGALHRILDILLGVAEIGLHLAEGLLNLALRLQPFVAHDFACGFLDRALRLLDPAFDLVLVHAHDVLLVRVGRRER